MEHGYTLGQDVELYLIQPVTDADGNVTDCATAQWYVIPEATGMQESLITTHDGPGTGQYRAFYPTTMAGWHLRKFVGTNPRTATTGRFYVYPDAFTP